MATARELMHGDATCVRTDHTAADAARLMAEQGAGAVPICGTDNKIKGVVTDRDLVVKVLSQGCDAGTFPAGDINQAEAVTIGADGSAEDVFATMVRHKVRRLPVIDDASLVGVNSIFDIAGALSNVETGDLVEALSAA